ncbi:hypothetical protein K5549_011074 [Capra hircus]|nr:hypothetical protein K5549_011074 [Capra hircus]
MRSHAPASGAPESEPDLADAAHARLGRSEQGSRDPQALGGAAGPPCQPGAAGWLGPKMVAVQNYLGNPAPPGKPVLTFQTGDVIELLRGDPESQWWEGRLVQTRKSGYFPSSSVKPCPVDGRPPISRPLSREMDYTAYPWFAGNMERQQTDNLLKSHPSGTYLIRERPAEAERFAISIKFNDEVKHIKVVEKDSWVHITEAKKFESLLGAREDCLEAEAAVPVYIPQELVEYYQCHSLKESFKQLDTTLKYPYKARERTASRASSRSPASCASYNFSFLSPQGLGLASQGSSTPFWSGTAAARGRGGPGLPPANPQPQPERVHRHCSGGGAGKLDAGGDGRGPLQLLWTPSGSALPSPLNRSPP